MKQAAPTYSPGTMVWLARGNKAPRGTVGIVAAEQKTKRGQTIFVLTLVAGRLKMDSADVEPCSGNALKSVFERMLLAETNPDPRFDCPHGCPNDALKPCRHVAEAQARVKAFEF